MAIDTGTRLAKVITSHCIPTLHSTDLIPVESIVMSRHDSEAKAELAVTASSAVSKMVELSNTLLSVYKEENNEFATKMCTTLNYVIPSLLPVDQGPWVSAPFMSLLEVMVKQSTLIEEYRLHIGKLRRELDSEDAIIREIEHLADRHQLVYLGGCVSDLVLMKHGVPQGSILSPLFHSFY